MNQKKKLLLILYIINTSYQFAVTTDIHKDGTKFQIFNWGHGNCIQKNKISKCDSKIASQIFQFKYIEDEDVLIYSGEKCLIHGGKKLYFEKCQENWSDHRWRIENKGDGFFKIRNPYYSGCLNFWKMKEIKIMECDNDLEENNLTYRFHIV